ncbi:MAG: MarR family transcriptional regulator [Saprospiraceae bacterium]|nr:MarR family transcriptional regulator [Saprospiraceae bacterium]
MTMKLEDEIKTNKFQGEVHKAHLNILVSAAWLRTRIIASLKPFGLTSEQYNVLRILRGQTPQGIRVKDITRRMLERNSNTTRIIDRLENKGLVQRLASERDRRERAIILTGEGLKMLSDIDQYWEKHSPHQSVLDETEARILNELLDKMRV